MPSFVSRQTDAAQYYFLSLNPRPTEDLTVVCGGMESCARDYLVNRDSLPYYTMEFVARGNCRVSVNHEVFSLGPGSVYCYGPATPHRIENSGAGPLAKFFVCLQGSKVTHLLWECFLRSGRPLQIPEYRWIHDLFRMLQDCGERGGPTAQESCQLIIRLILDRVQELSACSKPPCNKALMTFQSCRSYISQNFATIRSIGEVARHCNVHRAYMPQLFARFAQTTPSHLLNHYKMNAAARLLLEGNLLVKEVAARVGFDDPLHFSQSFKKFFGVSPRKFAREHPSTGGGFPAESARGRDHDVGGPLEWPRAVGG